MSGSTNRAVGIKVRSCEESLNCDSRIKWGLIFFTGKPECKKSVNILVKVYNTLHPLYYLPVISFVYVRLYPNETWLTEFLPSSDEVDKCILWLHFERQQGHLEDWEKVKGKWEKISREPREVTDRLTANIIHLLDWWITPAMSHPHETCDSCWHDTLTSLTVPELMYFFFLPFFLGFNTLTIREETWNKLFNKQVRTHYIVFPHISKLIWTGGDLIRSNKGWNS